MKICILTQPRTSSTNLTIMLGQLMSLTVFNEPFHGLNKNRVNDKKQIESGDNLIMKEMLFVHFVDELTTYEDYIKWSKDHFDKVIFLIRRDVISQSESLQFHMQNTIKDIDNLYKWHIPQCYDMSIVKDSVLLNEANRLSERNDLIKESSIKDNIPLFCYEDLIKNNGNNETLKELLNYLGGEFDNEIVYDHYGPHKKVRIQEKTEKTLI